MKEEEVVISVLTIQGLVQGVGFRSFIYRIASEMNICGEVDNRNNGVCIRATLTPVQREGILEDLAAGVPVTWLSARFHNTLAWLLVEMAKQYRMQTGTDKVVISGGCFQNKRLTEQLQRMFA